MEEPESAARASLVRGLVIYAALLAVDVLALYYIASRGSGGASYVTFSVVGVVGLLLAYQVVQHLRDLDAPLAETDGIVMRKWARADLIIAWNSYYVAVGRTVFRIGPLQYAELREDTLVKVVHFPNTLNVVSIHEIAAPPADPPSEF